ncbi:MAG: hypothetical protein VXX99_02090 [Bacteroidota bacterium]|nr:hypothetical protein [Bacteroidota bacterium]
MDFDSLPQPLDQLLINRIVNLNLIPQMLCHFSQQKVVVISLIRVECFQIGKLTTKL